MEELENQLAGAVKQLSVMQEEVQNLQKSPLKSTLQASIHTLEEKSPLERTDFRFEGIHSYRMQAGTFRSPGAMGFLALDNLARFFHLRQSFEGNPGHYTGGHSDRYPGHRKNRSYGSTVP
mgnify:CR=1 FL=1